MGIPLVERYSYLGGFQSNLCCPFCCCFFNEDNSLEFYTILYTIHVGNLSMFKQLTHSIHFQLLNRDFLSTLKVPIAAS